MLIDGVWDCDLSRISICRSAVAGDRRNFLFPVGTTCTAYLSYASQYAYRYCFFLGNDLHCI